MKLMITNPMITNDPAAPGARLHGVGAHCSLNRLAAREPDISQDTCTPTLRCIIEKLSSLRNKFSPEQEKKYFSEIKVNQIIVAASFTPAAMRIWTYIDMDMDLLIDIMLHTTDLYKYTQQTELRSG